ncbi:MAG TPA: PAS domain S-box protein [Flavobacteriales bacterium]|nr:PAS domain S-box protein [Flavobacteriales bacterium]
MGNRPGRSKTQAEEFAELQRRYDDLLNGNLAGIFRTTIDGRFVECNDAMAHVLGYSDKDELMAQHASALYFTVDDRTRYISQLKETGRLVNFEIRLRHKSGSEVHVLENVYLVHSANGEATVLGMLMDITPIKQAQESQRKAAASYRNLVERMQDGLLLVRDGIVRYANPAAARLLGTDPIGRAPSAAFHPDDRPQMEEALKRASGGAESELVVRLEQNEAQQPLLVASSILLDGEPAIQVSIHDQTSRERVIRERVQLQIAQEVNTVLREEIDHHRRTQEELRNSRRFARSLIDSSLDMIMAADKEGRVTEYNPAASIRFGYEAEEVLGKDTRLLYADPSEYKRVQQELDKYGTYTGEVRNMDKHGRPFTSFLAASRLFDEHGELIGAMGVSRDITRMKQDQEALRASEERYRDLFENATDLIQSVSNDGRFEYVNNAWRAALGYTEADLLRLTMWDIVHPDHRSICNDLFTRVISGEDVGIISTVFLAKDGSPIAVEGTSNLRNQDGLPVATRSIFRNVTHERAARQAAEGQQAKMRALFESSEHMFWSVDPGLRLTSFNKGYADMIERLYGVKPELNTDRDLPRKEFASSEYHDFWASKYAEAFKGQALRFETDRTDKNGNRVCNEVFISPVFGAEGKVEEVFGIGHEITEQKIAEETVREQAARLKAIFESSANMMIWTLGREFRLTSFNGHFERSIAQIHGIEFSLGDDFVQRMAPRVRPGLAKQLIARYSAALRGNPQQFEVELIDRRGEPAWVENFLNPIVVDGNVTEISCLAYGITDRKEAQRALEHSLAEKEVLLKEVHHRVKNNLQVISSITKLQGERDGIDPKVREMLHHSRDRVRSMALIHESLYQNKQFSSIDLADYIDGLARNLLLSYSTSGRIALDLDLQPVHLSIDQAMPCGLILNEVISNALKHGFSENRQGTIRIVLRMEEDRVRVEAMDDGVGFPEGFDEERDGGLGLELIQLLSTQLDGRMERRSEVGVSYLLTFERVNPKAHGANERTGR